MKPNNINKPQTIPLSLSREAIRLLKEYASKWNLSTGQAFGKIVKEYVPVKKKVDLRHLGIRRKNE